MSFKNNKISKNEEEWRKILSDEAFEATRKKATEAPFSGEYNSNYLLECIYVRVATKSYLILLQNLTQDQDGLVSMHLYQVIQ